MLSYIKIDIYYNIIKQEVVRMTYLTKPLQAGSLKLSNRLVMPPMATHKAESDGRVSQAILNYYDEKSRGGYISLIIIEHSFVTVEGKASANQISDADDSVIEPLRKLADVIHHNGSKAVMQINHAGAAALEDVTGKIPVAPSARPEFLREERTMPRQLSRTEIADIVKAFGDAARRTKEAGFDGVEIHSAHGYLLSQFLSPLCNKRKDEYGGDVHNRIRIHLEIIKEVRRIVGDDFPVLLRLGASDYKEGGTTIEDSKIAAKEFEKAGINILDISGGLMGYNVPGLNGEGYFAPLSEAIKAVVTIPVILTSGITKVQSAEKLLQAGKADLIGVGRAILKDSSWAERAIESLG